MKPIIVLNVKTYSQATGNNAVELAKTCEKVAKELDADIRIAVQATDIKSVAEAVSIPVYAQHIDPVGYGSNTGWIMPEAVKEAGATGTLLNHSEHRIPMDVLEASVKRAREMDFDIIVCAVDDKMGEEVKKFKPDFIAVEPPELIGGDISVSTAQPELITASVDRICKGENATTLLVGAGVKNGQDVKIGLELGASGVLLASGVAKSDDPESALRGLLDF